MDLIQRKLTRAEWEGIEVPVDENEKEILDLIKDGYNDVNIKYNHNQSLISYMRIEPNRPMQEHLFAEYFQKNIDGLCSKYNLKFKYTLKKSKKHKPKKADLIRIQNINSNANFPNIGATDYKIFEFLLLEVCEDLLKHKQSESTKWVFYY